MRCILKFYYLHQWKMQFSAINQVKGASGNSIFVMIARHFRADDCTDAGGRATQDAKAE
jgi:hypothetical protein